MLCMEAHELMRAFLLDDFITVPSNMIDMPRMLRRVERRTVGKSEPVWYAFAYEYRKGDAVVPGTGDAVFAGLPFYPDYSHEDPLCRSTCVLFRTKTIVNDSCTSLLKSLRTRRERGSRYQAEKSTVKVSRDAYEFFGGNRQSLAWQQIYVYEILLWECIRIRFREPVELSSKTSPLSGKRDIPLSFSPEVSG